MNVPGNNTNPANKIHVKKDESMLSSRGMVSRARSMFMYRVPLISVVRGGRVGGGSGGRGGGGVFGL